MANSDEIFGQTLHVYSPKPSSVTNQQQHPITPPEDLVRQCRSKIKAAADEELEACLEHLSRRGFSDADILCLRTARRPKPPSLKEQALDSLQSMRISPELIAIINANTDLKDKYETIRRALEALPND